MIRLLVEFYKVKDVCKAGSIVVLEAIVVQCVQGRRVISDESLVCL